jgi:hypothetical protein
LRAASLHQFKTRQALRGEIGFAPSVCAADQDAEKHAGHDGRSPVAFLGTMKFPTKPIVYKKLNQRRI